MTLENKITEISGKNYRIIIRDDNSKEEYVTAIKKAITDNVPIIVATGESCCTSGFGAEAYNMLKDSKVELVVYNSCGNATHLKTEGNTKVVTFGSFELRDQLLKDYTTGIEINKKNAEYSKQYENNALVQKDPIGIYFLESRILSSFAANIAACAANSSIKQGLGTYIASRMGQEAETIDAIAEVFEKYKYNPFLFPYF